MGFSRSCIRALARCAGSPHLWNIIYLCKKAYRMTPTLKTASYKIKSKCNYATKHGFYSNILPPYALVATSDLSNAALLCAGVPGLQEHLVKVTNLVQI